MYNIPRLHFLELDEEVVRPHVVINPGRDSFELVPSGAGSMFCEYEIGECFNY